MILYSYFSIILFLVNGVFCNEKAKWENSCKELGQNMQNLVLELDQLKNNEGFDAIIEKINKLKDYSSQLSQIVQKDKHILLEPLIFEHAQKVGRFCQNLLMGEGLQREVISERLHHGIDQIKDRVVQIRQLMDTIFMDWEVWPILYNFELFEGPPDLLNNLIEQLGQKIGKMRNQLGRSGSYYNNQAFDDAMKQLMVLAINVTDGPIKKFGQIWRIVPKLMVKSMSEMLDNLLMDLIDPFSRFYGVEILFDFAKEINIAENVCADILRKSTLTLVESILIIDQLKRLKNKANELFEVQKSSMIDQIRNIGQKLKNKMEVFKIEKGTLKRQKLIETLQKVLNLFVIIYNELFMVDLLGSSMLLKKNIDKLEQFLKQDIVKNGMPTDDVELSDQILGCLNTEEVCKLIEQDGANVINRILF